jgi:hypothetical protein
MTDKNIKDGIESIPDAGNMHVALEQFPDSSYFVSSPYTSDDSVQSMSVNFFEPLDEQVARLEAAGYVVIKDVDGAVAMVRKEA